MGTAVTWPGGATGASATAYTVPAAGELNWSALSAFLIALGQGAQATTFQKFAVRKATTTPVTVAAATDCVVETKLAAPGAVAVNLPAGADKQVFFVCDGTGDAASNNVTINRAGSDTINGATSFVITNNFGGVMLVYNLTDTDWKIVYRNRPIATLTASKALVSDSAGNVAVSTASTTQLQYLASATGTTGTTSTNVVFSTSPSFTTPILGTPTSGTLTNCTGYVPSNLSATTGSGSAVLASGPTMTTPALGVATATSVNFGVTALSYYGETTQAATFAWNGSGGNTGSITMTVIRIGSICTVMIPALSATTGTSSDTLTADTALPVGYRPATAAAVYAVGIKDNSVNQLAQVGLLSISTAGIVTLSKAGGSAFVNSTASGTPGRYSFTFTV